MCFRSWSCWATGTRSSQKIHGTAEGPSGVAGPPGPPGSDSGSRIQSLLSGRERETRAESNSLQQGDVGIRRIPKLFPRLHKGNHSAPGSGMLHHHFQQLLHPEVSGVAERPKLPRCRPRRGSPVVRAGSQPSCWTPAAGRSARDHRGEGCWATAPRPSRDLREGHQATGRKQPVPRLQARKPRPSFKLRLRGLAHF